MHKDDPTADEVFPHGRFDGQWALVATCTDGVVPGQIRELMVLGEPGLRVDIPRPTGNVTRFYQRDDIHHIELCTEEQARALASHYADTLFAGELLAQCEGVAQVYQATVVQKRPQPGPNWDTDEERAREEARLLGGRLFVDCSPGVGG